MCERDICEYSYTILRLSMILLLSLIEDIKINLIIDAGTCFPLIFRFIKSRKLPYFSFKPCLLPFLLNKRVINKYPLGVCAFE